MTDLARMRLLQLSSQALPIGGYSHSHGLEAAIESRCVTDADSAERWIFDVLEYPLLRYEIPCLRDMTRAWATGDHVSLARHNDEFLASRESAEMRRATVQMGYSLRALLGVLPDLDKLNRCLRCLQEPSLPCVWSGAADAWQIGNAESIGGYLWSWAENQALVAIKSVPIGQSAGQRILLKVARRIAESTRDDAFEAAASRSNFAPGLAILSARHETQYSRLFRS